MLSPEEKAAKSQEVREATVARYDWDDCAKVWMDYIDTYKPKLFQGKWNASPNLFEIPKEMPPNLDNESFVEFLFYSVINEPDSAFGYEATKLVRDLNIGAVVEHGIVDPIDREKIFQQFKNRGENKLLTEQLRTGMASLSPDKFIEVANGK